MKNIDGLHPKQSTRQKQLPLFEVKQKGGEKHNHESMLRTSNLQLYAALRSEVAQAHWSHKIVRKAAPTKYFTHPTYVMAREKILSKMWREHVLFSHSVWPLVGFFGVGAFFKA